MEGTTKYRWTAADDELLNREYRRFRGSGPADALKPNGEPLNVVEFMVQVAVWAAAGILALGGVLYIWHG